MKLLPNSFSGQFFPSLNRAYLCYNYFSREHLYTHDKKNLQLMKIVASKPQQRQQAMTATCCSYFKVAVYMKLSILNTGM